ncbi:MAG: hypothetical protein KDK76_00375 [Chlamydiia bacterium]|nr:hypothetical protein [Chlamydiia bacterium]
MKTHFFELELERKVNVIAYDIIKQGILFKNLTPTVSNQTPLPPFELSIEGIGKKRFVGHYHLYHCIPEKHTSPYYKIWLGICFDKKKCKPQHKSFQFSFSFLGKIMDEKSPISHGDGKEPIQVKDERVPVDIQTIHQSQ